MTTNSPAATEWLSGWRWRLLLASIALAAAGYLGVSLWGGWNDVTAAAQRIGLLTITAALLLSLLNYGLRFVRWQMYLRHLGHTLPAREHMRIYVSGFALTTTPAKAGEVLRSVLLKPRGVPYNDSLAALLSERVSDLLAVLIMAMIGISQYPQYSPLLWLFALLIPAFWCCIGSQTLQEYWQKLTRPLPSALARLNHRIIHITATIRRCHTPSLILYASILSLIAWGAEGVAFYWVLHPLHNTISLETALFIYATAMLAGAASFMPGGLGGAELAMTGLLHLNGVSLPDAIAAALIIRLATLWFAVMLGFFCLTSEVKQYKK